METSDEYLQLVLQMKIILFWAVVCKQMQNLHSTAYFNKMKQHICDLVSGSFQLTKSKLSVILLIKPFGLGGFVYHSCENTLDLKM